MFNFKLVTIIKNTENLKIELILEDILRLFLLHFQKHDFLFLIKPLIDKTI